MNRVLAFEVCSNLEEDREFAARMRAAPVSAQVDLLNHYLMDRGIEAGDAQVLIVAYLAGSTHTLLWAERVVARHQQA